MMGVTMRENIERIVEQAGATAGRKKGASLLLQDPVFEAAWDDMPHDEQFEFPEVREEKQRGRVRRRMEGVRTQSGQRRKRRPRAAVVRAEAPDVAPAPARGGEDELRQEDPRAADAVVDLAPAQDEEPAAIRRCRRQGGDLVPRGMPWGRVVDGRPHF